MEILLLLAGLWGSGAAARADALPGAEARAIAAEAYLYAVPMLENYRTLFRQAVDASAPEYVGGFGVYRHYAELFTPANHDVVTPNNDTPYSWAWLDLRAEPWVLTVPAVPKDRYYVAQFVDLFTYNFAYVGVRATGFDAGSYLVAGPGWRSEIPPGIKKVFHSETSLAGIVTRTMLQGPGDVANVRALQARYRLEPLSRFAGTPPPPAAPPIPFPPYDSARTRSPDFIAYLNFLLQFCQPPDPSETELMKRFAKIGIGPGQPFDAAKLSPAFLAALDAGVKDGQDRLQRAIARTSSSTGLLGTRADLKNDYLKRAVAASIGLYGNSIEEAWYGGYVLDGAKANVIRFPKEGLPQAKFFWSATLYTLPDRFLYANPLRRYSLGDRTPGLRYEADGSLTLYIGHDSPGAGRESNWLPAPAGPCSVAVRIYGPGDDVIAGHWKLPVVAVIPEPSP